MIRWQDRIRRSGRSCHVMARGRRRVRVIEDDPETAEQLGESLAPNGYQVDLAVNGSDGLSRGRTGGYAVMTIHRMPPRVGGTPIAPRSLRSKQAYEPIPNIREIGFCTRAPD